MLATCSRATSIEVTCSAALPSCSLTRPSGQLSLSGALVHDVPIDGFKRGRFVQVHHPLSPLPRCVCVAVLLLLEPDLRHELLRIHGGEPLLNDQPADQVQLRSFEHVQVTQ